VDVFDALTSDRPYRRAWSRQDALEYLRQEAGRLFDPEVCKELLTMLAPASSPSSSPGPALALLPTLNVGADARHKHLAIGNNGDAPGA
jgi:hypothetical protein